MKFDKLPNVGSLFIIHQFSPVLDGFKFSHVIVKAGHCPLNLERNLNIPLRKLAYAKYRDFFSCNQKKKIFLIFMLKTLIVGTRCEAILTSTHNICFGSKVTKLYTPVYHSFSTKKWGIRGYNLHGHVILVSK